MTASSVDINRLSIVDLIESPLQELTDVLQTLTPKQKEVCLNIRDRERSNITTDTDDNYMLPPDDPLEIEYQQLKVISKLLYVTTGCPKKNYTLFWRAVAPLNFELGIKVGCVLESSGSQL